MKLLSVLWSGMGVTLLALSAGCSSMHRVVNTGDRMLYAVTVQSGETKFGHGYLPPKATAGYSGSMRITRSPAPVVSWKMSENGELISQEVALDSEPRQREVVFEIDGKTVKGTLQDRL